MKSFKKITLTLLIALILVSTFLPTVLAAEKKILTANSDLTEFNIGNDKYIKLNVDFIYNTSNLHYMFHNYSFDSGLEDYYSVVICSMNEDESIISVYLSNRNGSKFSATYVHENIYKTIKTLKNTKRTENLTLFRNGDNKKIDIQTSLLENELSQGETTKITVDSYCDYYTVCQEYQGFYKIVGYIIDASTKMYYMSIEENENSDTEYDIFSYNEIDVIEIATETPTVEIPVPTFKPKNDVLTNLTSGIIVFIFIVVPVILLILGIIFSTKTKGIYKKLWISILALSALLLLAVTIIITQSII